MWRWKSYSLTIFVFIFPLFLFSLVISSLLATGNNVFLSPNQRRIQQKDVDYTGYNRIESKEQLPYGTGANISNLDGALKQNVNIGSSVPSETALPSSLLNDIKAIQEAKQLEVMKGGKDMNTVLERAQMGAVAALERGLKLTVSQRQLVGSLSEKRKKELQMQYIVMRERQEKTYIMQLRDRHQIVPQEGGGEKVISSSSSIIRFPSSLKTKPPVEWEDMYRIFYNVTHYPWSKQKECQKYSISFSLPNSRPTAALASFPSSGNTWIRYLIECASGYFTGSLYDDTSLTRKGLYGEGLMYNSGMTVLQKTHGYATGDYMKLPHSERVDKNHMAELNFQGVIIIRNPFKALISHRHLDVGGHTGFAPKAHFIGPGNYVIHSILALLIFMFATLTVVLHFHETSFKGWTEFVELKIKLWKEFYSDWLTYSNPLHVHVVHYELVKKDLKKEMEGILNYLHIPINHGRLDCVLNYSDGLFKRKPSKNSPLTTNPYTDELKSLIYKAIDEVNDLLKRYGKIPFPLDKYEMYNSQEAEKYRY